MQEAYYLPVSPDNSQCWQIQRDDKFLIEADQANSFDIYTDDLSTANVLRVSVIQKTPQIQGAGVGTGIEASNIRSIGGTDSGSDDDNEGEHDSVNGIDNNVGGRKSRSENNESISCDTMQMEDGENLTDNSIWNDYEISQLPSLENNLENVISEELMDTNIVSERLLRSVESGDETMAVFQPVSAEEANDSFVVTCRCCDKNFAFYDLKLHITEKSTEGYYGCDSCAEIFLLKEDLNNHALTHLDSADDTSHCLLSTCAYECLQSGDKFTNQISFTEHKKGHTDIRTACSHCAEEFTNIVDLEAHVNECHTVKRVKTDSSDYVKIGKQRTDNEHKQITVDMKSTQPQVDGDNNQQNRLEVAPSLNEQHQIQIQCPKCKEKFSFAEEGEIDNHLRSRIPTTYYKCGFCETIVTDKNEFNEHMKNHTTVVESNSGNKFPYKCSYCENLAFETIEELTSHIEMHVPRSIFVCPTCNAQFVREGRQQGMVKIGQCARKDTTNKLKTTPILTPADKVASRENFKCKTCAAVFRKQDDFNKHVKTHIMPDTKQDVSDVKVDPSYCAYCSSELLSIAEIIVHIRKHTEERKLFPCSNCDKKTTHDRNSNTNNRGKENLCNYCLSKNNTNFRVHG